jgi:hypothetical protein
MDAPRLARVSYGVPAWSVGCCHLFGLMCSPQAAGPDEIRGSTPDQSRELVGPLLQAGLADPGPTCCAITPSVALANRRRAKSPGHAPLRRRPGGTALFCLFLLIPLCSIGGTTASSRPVWLPSAARSVGQGWPARATAARRLGLAGASTVLHCRRSGCPVRLVCS